ncbi:MAG: plastocyanin/azurin family copper-binding protein [Rubrobacteraceae bacterium]
MRRATILTSILLGATIALASCGGGAPQEEQPADGAGELTQEGTVVVTIPDSTSFVPSNIAVSPGTTVRWVNEDSIAHTVTSTDPEGLFDSGEVAAGESFEFTFEEAGEVAYVCVIHGPPQTGAVLVREGGGATVLEGSSSGGEDDGGGAY